MWLLRNTLTVNTRNSTVPLVATISQKTPGDNNKQRRHKKHRTFIKSFEQFRFLHRLQWLPTPVQAIIIFSISSYLKLLYHVHLQCFAVTSPHPIHNHSQLQRYNSPIFLHRNYLASRADKYVVMWMSALFTFRGWPPYVGSSYIHFLSFVLFIPSSTPAYTVTSAVASKPVKDIISHSCCRSGLNIDYHILIQPVLGIAMATNCVLSTVWTEVI